MRPTRRALRVFVVLLSCCGVTLSCGKPRSSAAPDAGHAAPVVHARPSARAGELQVDLTKSKLSLTIIKDRDTKSPVTATLALRDGAVALAAGTARLSVDLDTFDSGIPVRNERVRGIFFETSGLGWETAELRIDKIPDDVLAKLRAHTGVLHAALDSEVRVHGRSAKVPLLVDAGYGPTGTLWVKSAGPIVVKISDFGLTDNLKRLSSICMHDSIDDVVNVDVALELPER